MFKNWPTTGVILLVGEEDLALQYARKILVMGSLRSDALIDSKTHTDFRIVQPEEKSQWIKIDQIRELIEWAAGKPQIASTQVAVISPAHALNIQAANALLKTLEESAPDALFILVTDRPSFIPATIRSRCYWIRCQNRQNKPENLLLKDKLKADLDSLKLKKADPVTIASQWSKQEPKEVLLCLMLVLQEEIKKAAMQSMRCNKKRFDFFDKVVNAKRELDSPNQPNVQLLMESLLIIQ